MSDNPENDDDPWDVYAKGGAFSKYVAGSVVPKSWLPAIGYVIVAFSTLDAGVDLTIAHLLLGADDRDIRRALAAAIPNYRPRIELLVRLIELKVTGKGDKEKLQKIAKAIEVVANERHRLIHDYMASITYDYRFPPTLKLERKEAVFLQKQKQVKFTKSALKELGTRMLDLTYRLQRFRKDDPRWKRGEQFPWRDRPRKQPHQGSHRRPSGRDRA